MIRKYITVATQVATLVVFAGVGACAGQQPTSRPAPEAAVGRQSTVVDVESRHWNIVQVFLRVGASRHRLGEVEPFSRTSFTLPEGLSGRVIQIELRPFGSAERFTTHPVSSGSGGLSLFVSSDVRKSILIAW